MAVEITEMAMQVTQVEKSVDATKQMVGWDAVFGVEGVEQLIVFCRLSSHQGPLRFESVVLGI